MTLITTDTNVVFSLGIRLSIYGYSMLVFASAWGWSKLANELLGINTPQAAVNLLQGFCILVLLVGILATFHLAFPSALVLILLVGLCLFVRYARLAASACNGRKLNSFHCVIGLTLAGLILYNFETQFPSLIFNYHDDFEKYFTYPKRLLQTGTLKAGPLNALGTEILGSAAALQAFILILFPLPFINGADASWGLILVYLLVLSPFRSEKRNIPWALINLLLVTFLYLYYANVSTLYMGIALILGMLFFTHRNNDEYRDFFFLGAFYASAITLKPTFLVFIVIHAMVVFGEIALRLGPKTTIQRYGGWSFAGGALFFLPWLILHLDHYFLAILGKSTIFSYPQETLGEFQPAEFGILLYAHFRTFTILAILCWLLPLVNFYIARKQRLKAHMPRYLFGDAILGGLLMVVYIAFVLAGPYLNGAFTHMRYFAPILAGSFFYLFATYTARKIPEPTRRIGRTLRALPLLAILLICVISGRINLQKQRDLLEAGSLHYFSHLTVTAPYRKYMLRTAWSLAEKKRIEKAQASVPEGEPILAWLNANFLLDYGRNPIFDIDPAGIASPWAHVPEVQYVIWQSRGYGVRSKKLWYSRFQTDAKREKIITLKCLKFINNLSSKINSSEILYSDGEIHVARMETPRMANP